jgi:hypothetical protein
MPLRRLPLVFLVVLAAGCGSAAPPASPSAAPSIPPGSSADSSGPWLRASTTQAIPPLARFAVPDTAVVTADGRYVTVGPVDAIYPGPLLPALRERAISDAGRQRILDEATRLGLLGGQTDFTGRAIPGGQVGRLDLTVDGIRVTLTGDPQAQIQCITTPCDPPPGTPAAFAELWTRIGEPDTWLGADLGPDAPFVPKASALLVGPAPVAEAGLARAPVVLPVDLDLGGFGVPVAGGTQRCGIVDGGDATALRPAFEAADQLTQWIQGPTMSATFGLAVRPIVADEDPCAETFGGS